MDPRAASVVRKAEQIGDKLSLDEPISLTFSRREWAIILIAIANDTSQAPAHLRTLERVNDEIQKRAAPVGVIVRAMRDASQSN